MSAATHHSSFSLLWSAPLFDPSGYADDARNLILAADSVGIPVRANELRWSSRQIRLNEKDWSRMRALLSSSLFGDIVNVCNVFPQDFIQAEGASLNIGRTVFETDRIPDVWVAKCNKMDQIWVPCSFNVETFARSGVDLEKLRVLPQALDADVYKKNLEPLQFRNGLGYVFLSSFDWSHRKGWDLLLTAFCREFKGHQDVTLVIKTYSSAGKTVQEIQSMAIEFVEKQLGIPKAKMPRVVFIDEMIPSESMPRFYQSADCFVLPTRGEGWCRPFMEAMASGIPVIGTRYGGHLDYMHDGNSLLIDCALMPVSEEAVRESPVYKNHRWAEPIVEHLRELMRQAFVDRKGTQDMAQRARTEILATYNREKIGSWIASLLHVEEPKHGASPNYPKSARGMATPSSSIEATPVMPVAEKKKTPSLNRPVRVQWEGGWFTNHSLAKVNRELASALIRRNAGELSLLPFEKDEYAPMDEKQKLLHSKISAPLSGSTDCWISHRWPARLEAPEQGHWIWMQPWEFGSLPTQWARIVREKVDDVWVPSNYMRKLYLEAGLTPDRVHVIPHGVDTKLFNPQAKPLTLPTTKKFKMLFVGGTIWRKGIDVLLTAYSAAFTDRDDVSLVVKDIGPDTFYRGSNARDMIHRIQDTPGSPEIIYLDRRLSEEEMAGLYTACQCLVHPYRGEGFGMPVAEAMACGLPVIVTEGGACDDFCDEQTGYRIPARRRVLPNPGVETVGVPWVLEPDPTILARRMREIMVDPNLREEKGRNGQSRIVASYTWDHVAELAQERMVELCSRPIFRQQGPLGDWSSKLELLHFENELPEVSSTAACNVVALDVAKGISQALQKGLHDSSAEWVGLFSPGARFGPEWIQELRRCMASGGTYLVRQPQGVFLLFPKVLSQGMEFDRRFQSGAAILDFARALASRGIEIKELKNAPVNFALSNSIYSTEIEAVDALIDAAWAIEHKEYTQALHMIAGALSKKPDYREALYAAAEVLLSTGEWNEALQSSLRLIDLDPDKADYYELLGRCYYERKEYEKAEEALKAAVRLDVHCAQAHNDLAILYWERGQHDAAIDSIQAAIAANPDDDDVIYNCASILEQAGHIDQVIPLLERYLLRHPADAEVRTKLETLKKPG